MLRCHDIVEKHRGKSTTWWHLGHSRFETVCMSNQPLRGAVQPQSHVWVDKEAEEFVQSL
jgi:hypothetical protein